MRSTIEIPYVIMIWALVTSVLLSCGKISDAKITHLGQQNGYSQAVVVEGNGIRTIYVSGQIGVGETLEEQMRSVLANLTTQLGNAGATLADVIKMNTYIVDYKQADLEVFREVRREVMGDENMPASTLVGVTSLARSEWLIEIEAVAVLSVD